MAELSSLVRSCLHAVIVAMKESRIWDVPRPADRAFADMGAFGGRTMAFEQWLRWVFVPKVESLLTSGGPWPSSSSVAVTAMREGDTNPLVAALVPSLSRFDALFNAEDCEQPPLPPVHPAAEASERSHVLFEQGDYDGALAAIEDAIAKDSSLPNAHNFAGWILLSRPSPSPAVLEAAAAHFRQALASTPAPEPLCNLANALVALGRSDEAIAMLQHEGRVALTAHAHNWLAWYFIHRQEFVEAVTQGREAVKLSPHLGSAWGTLAEALERTGAEGEAYKAYLEGLSAGGMKDPGLARRRALALETALRGRGEVPLLDPFGLANERTARANEVGRAILREIMAMPEFSTGRVLTLGRAIPVPPGDVPTAWIGSRVGERIVVHALVFDLQIFCTAEVLARREHGIVFHSIQVRGADVSEATSAVAEWLRAGGDADPTTVNPLDVVVMLNELLTLAVPARRGFRVSAATHNPETMAIAAVLDDGVGLGATSLPEGGVRIELAPEHKGAERTQIEAPSLPRFIEVQGEIIESTRRALAARDAFLARPFTVGHAARATRQALIDAGFARRGRWECAVTRDDYLFGWPSASIHLHEGTAQRLVVSLEESGDGVRVRVDDGRPIVLVHSAEELRSEVPAIVGRAHLLCETLTADALMEGRVYRVLLPFAGFESEERVKFVEGQYVAYESCQIYRFASRSRPEVRGELDDRSEADLAILRELGRYLEPA